MFPADGPTILVIHSSSSILAHANAYAASEWGMGTASATETATASESATGSETASGSASASGSGSASETASGSGSASETASASASETGSASRSASASTPASSASRTSSLLASLAAFSIDDIATAHYSFARRLAHEHRWSHGFAERAIVEYKRFLALTSLAGHLVCPSEQVDQVWHLHLTYTRSYWERLCPQVLGRPLHHTPTAGGPAEHDKHVAMYERTLASYRRLFGEAPPADLWPPSAQRFGKDVHAARVSTADNVILSKASLLRAALLAATVVTAALASWLTA